MSLLDEFKTNFHMMDKRSAPDGAGGFFTTWEEGAPIDITVRFDSSMEARRAEKEGVTSVYTFLIPQTCALSYHDVLRRDSDGQVFRITSNSGDSHTPPSSPLGLTAVTAEKWELTR